MATFQSVVDAYVSVREYDKATLGRLEWWVEQFGDTPIADITEAQVDASLVQLSQRGRLRAGRNITTRRTGKPLAGATFNRYVSQLAQVFKFARQVRVLPRSHVPPTRGVEKAPERTHHDRYFTEDEIDRLVKVVRVVDTEWGKLEALIVLAYHTGLRKSNLLGLTWADVNLAARTITVAATKNGDPHVAPLSQTAADLLAKLPRNTYYVFEGKPNRPFNFSRLWRRALDTAGITGRTFHGLRHSCGHRLAQSGASQGLIMRYMGHRSLSASARYMHANSSDKQRIADQVFS